MRGRKPKPTHLKIVQGTAQPCRMNPNEPVLDVAQPGPPEGLSAAARKHWPVVCERLAIAGVMTAMDVDALEGYCEQYARWRQAMTEVEKHGAVVLAANGSPVVSPWVSIANQSFDRMVKAQVEFGMTPSSRTRVSAAKKEPPKKGFAALD